MWKVECGAERVWRVESGGWKVECGAKHSQVAFLLTSWHSLASLSIVWRVEGGVWS